MSAKKNTNMTPESLRKIGGYQHYMPNVDDMPYIEFEMWFPIFSIFNPNMFRNIQFVIKESLIEEEIFSEKTK